MEYIEFLIIIELSLNMKVGLLGQILSQRKEKKSLCPNTSFDNILIVYKNKLWKINDSKLTSTKS